MDTYDVINLDNEYEYDFESTKDDEYNEMCVKLTKLDVSFASILAQTFRHFLSNI